MGVNIWNDLIRWASWSKTYENRLLAIFCGARMKAYVNTTEYIVGVQSIGE